MRPDLLTFAGEIFTPFARSNQRRWGETYLRGLMADGRRKSIEPMAARPATGATTASASSRTAAICTDLRLYVNFFLPQLVARQRLGARVRKRYVGPQTPYQRLLAPEAFSEEKRRVLKRFYRSSTRRRCGAG